MPVTFRDSRALSDSIFYSGFLWFLWSFKVKTVGPPPTTLTLKLKQKK